MYDIPMNYHRDNNGDKETLALVQMLVYARSCDEFQYH